jgi:methylthioribose-1-phosphate isomerase
MRPIDWIGDGARLIDQRLLPHQEVWVTCRSLADFESAIRDMLIRGAPAIGICAAYGLASVALQGGDLEEAAGRLAATRPTAVNLFWAIQRMREVWQRHPDSAQRLVQEALAIHEEDVAMCRSIGEHGADLFQGNVRILTHCNAGALATGDYGTALGVVRSLARRNQVQWVWVDETRPFLQGARLTAYELQREQIPCRLICDNMAGHFMQRKQVDAVIVGADRVTRSGDVANKIGTSTLAVLCKEYGVPFYVAAPWSTLDLAMDSGWDIPIEERSAEEVSHLAGSPVAPLGISVANPAFDVTFHPYITAIITERGVLRPPFADSIQAEVMLGQSG